MFRPRFIPLGEAALALSMTTDQVRELHARNVLHGSRIATDLWFEQSAVDDYLRRIEGR